MNKIKIKNLQKKIKVNQQKLKKLANSTLRQKGIEAAELSILLVDDRTITNLNYKYLKKNSPTDVIAFRMKEGRYAGINPQLLGDVVISVETAKNCAEDLNTSLEDELFLYLIHGILHLLGYRDKTKKGYLAMQKIQKEILGRYA